MTVRILQGDCRDVLKTLPDESAQCVVTSPPYWGLRDYGVAGQIGLEETPAAFVGAMAGVFAEVRRVLRSDGTLWLNLGDSYSGSGKGGNPDPGSSKQATNAGSQTIGTLYGKTGETARQAAVTNVSRRFCAELGFPPKQLMGMPWRVAMALQDAGWWLRQDIIWSKPNPMPESVLDRCTKAHEYLFLLAKSERYYFDSKSIAEDSVRAGDIPGGSRKVDVTPYQNHSPQHMTACAAKPVAETRNKRSVWTVPIASYAEAHFATFPPDLIEPCILAGCPIGGTVLDPFGGAGTTGLVADRLQRDAILIELNPEYAAMARKRIQGDAPLFAEVT